MRPIHTKYVTSAEEYGKRKMNRKSEKCPHCHVAGCLVGHGRLMGYGEGKQEKIQRGWRELCSKRYGKNGCGRTFQVLLADRLYHRLAPAMKLWRLLTGIVGGKSIKAVWDKIASPLSDDTGYRLWRAFQRSQTKIRTLLCREKSPPKLSSGSASAQVIEHINAVFAKPEHTTSRSTGNPIAEFQLHFQRAFLSG